MMKMVFYTMYFASNLVNSVLASLFYNQCLKTQTRTVAVTDKTVISIARIMTKTSQVNPLGSMVQHMKSVSDFIKNN